MSTRHSGASSSPHIPLDRPKTPEEIRSHYQEQFGGEPLIEIRDEVPELREGRGQAGVILGGFDTSADGLNAVVVAAEDNLLKGAAVQAIQNVNLALGLGEFAGLGLGDSSH